MPEKSTLLLPKFLTEKIVKSAAFMAITSVESFHFTSAHIKVESCCVIVLVPAMKAVDWPNYLIQPYPIEYCYQKNIGMESPELEQYRSIAQCKALQLWHGRNDGGTDVKPHLLITGDTRYWGGVKRDGIVVSCSGLQPHIDRMISGMVADLCIGLAYNEYVKWKTKNTTNDFVI